jgi:hypothetical protein
LEKENNQVFSIEMLEKVKSNVLKKKAVFSPKDDTSKSNHWRVKSFGLSPLSIEYISSSTNSNSSTPKNANENTLLVEESEIAKELDATQIDFPQNLKDSYSNDYWDNSNDKRVIQEQHLSTMYKMDSLDSKQLDENNLSQPIRTKRRKDDCYLFSDSDSKRR